MTTFGIHEAKTHLSRLIADAEKGEEVVITRGNEPVARIVPIRSPGKRKLGFIHVHFPDDAFDPLTDDEIALWEGA